MMNRLLCALLVFLLLIQPTAGATIASADPADTWTDIGDGGDFQKVCAVTVDSKGTVYATDCGAGKVKMLQNGTWTDITGSETFAYPYGIAADSKGNVVVADGWSGNLKKYASGSWSLVDTWEEGFPMAVAFDSNDNLYVVSIIDEEFGIGSVKRLADGDWEDIAEDVPFVEPAGIFVDHNDDIYVTSDLYHATNQIMKWSNGAWSSVEVNSYCPADAAVNSSNELYVLDIRNSIYCDNDIGVIKQSGGDWTEVYPLSSASDLKIYNDLFIDKYDNIYVVSNNSHIHKLLVTPPEVLGVSINPASGNVAQGDSLQLEAIVDAVGFADESVTWSSSDGSITVDASGNVTAAADAALGDYTITATSVFDGTKKGTATITVVEPPDTTAPVISLTSASDTTHNSTTLNFTSDEAGTYSFVVYEATAPAPDALTIEAQGTATAKGTGAAIAGANTASVTSGLAPSTEYKAYVIVKDAAGNLSDVAEISFETEDPPNSEISPVTATFDKYSESDGYDDITVTVTLNGNMLESVSNGGTPLYYSSDYAMTGNKLTIKKEYLEELEAGTVTLTLTFSAGEPQTLTITIIDSTPPAAPVLQSAEAGDAQVALTWSPVSDATGYAIYSRTAAGTYGTDPAATVAAPADSHTVTGLANGTTYYFVVKAVRSGIESDASNEESATPMTVPAAPTDVSAVAGDGEATVSFTAPTDNGGSAIIEYEVTASPGGVSATGSASPIIVTGLTNGTSYTFTVKAINAAGSSAASAASNAVTPTRVRQLLGK